MANESKELKALKEKLEADGQESELSSDKLTVVHRYDKAPGELKLVAAYIQAGMTDGYHAAEFMPFGYHDTKTKNCFPYYLMNIPDTAKFMPTETTDDESVMLRVAENNYASNRVYCLFKPEAVIKALELASDFLARACMDGKNR